MRVLLFTALFLFSTTVQALDIKTVVKAEVLSVRDGDTVDVMAFPWPGFSPETAIRLLGIDTPEMKGKCEAEVKAAHDAKEYLESILTKEVELHGLRYGKYAGRLLAEIITADGVNVSDALIEKGYARPYDGGKRKGWCGE